MSLYDYNIYNVYGEMYFARVPSLDIWLYSMFRGFFGYKYTQI